MQYSPHRRQFLRAATASATALTLSATSYARTIGANDRIRLGIIGCGSRGIKAHMEGVHPYDKSENIEIIAVADPWRVRTEMAAGVTEKWYGRAAQQFPSYRHVLDLKDVDAVMIASPDHVHTLHYEAAAKAGKDVYVEKPLSMDIESLKSACDAARAAGIIVQNGTQVRSYPTSTGCREIFRSGVLGRISRIEQHRNSTQPYWYRYLKDANAADVDWKEFLYNRPDRPFDAGVFTGWYGYREFSDGPIPGFASHFIDLVNFIVGTTFPTSVVAQGTVSIWKDEHKFTCPDNVEATWIYPEGFVVSYSTNCGNSGGNAFRIYGEQGVLDLTQWNKPTMSNLGAAKKGTLGKEAPVPAIDTPDHFLNWLQCLRSRKQPNASIDAGYQQSIAILMAVKAMDSGQRQIYDPVKREIRAG